MFSFIVQVVIPVTGSSFEAIDESSLMISPVSGQAKQTGVAPIRPSGLGNSRGTDS
jgi:hypothetical protein